MDELDKKLANDISEAIWDYCRAEDTEYGIPKVVGQEKATKVIVSSVKQAFRDAGWIGPMEAATLALDGARYIDPVVVIPEGYMTGQAWYDRFEEQLKIHPMMEGKYTVYDLAKKAAGIDR